MKIENLLEDIGLEFKIIDELNGIKIIKVIDKMHICFISRKGNQFIVDRDTFDYLDFNILPYCLLLNDTMQNKFYYIPLNKENNWVKSCFVSCDKEEIYLGKQVLNHQIDLQELRDKLCKFK